MISSILIPMAVLGGVGVLLALGLGIAAKKFSVEIDPKVESISAVLPQINCGACGYAGCSAYAEAVVLNGEVTNKCIPGGASVAEEVARLMGIESAATAIPRRAIVRCQGEKDLVKESFTYKGYASCRAANLVGGGSKACPTGCLYFGDCVQACPYGAFDWKPGTVPQVDWSKCVGCGKCVAQCPKGLIALIPITSKVTVRCLSPDKGAVVRQYCKVACIACKACERACPTDPKSAVVIDNHSSINTETCINCGKCAEACPTGSIQDRRGAIEVPTDTQGWPAVLSTRWPLPIKHLKKGNSGPQNDAKKVANSPSQGAQ